MFAAALWLLAAAGLAAQSFPALYDVNGVSAGDVLNVRRQPNASSEKLGALSAAQVNVEVIARDPGGKWGLVNIGEQSGWVALRYLRPQEPGSAVLTNAFWCFGTEPFWSLDVIDGQGATFSTPDAQTIALPAGAPQPGANYIDRFLLDLGGNTALLRRELCGDGMSDRSFGIAIDLFGPLSGGRLYSGCCSIAPR